MFSFFFMVVMTNLQLVLHSISDENCVKVLKKCREAILNKEKGGKVIIIDIVINDIKDKLLSFLKRKKKSNDKDKNIPSPSSGNYYRRIAFQVHFLAFLSLVSAIFLLVISSNIPPWRTITWIFCFIAVGSTNCCLRR